VNPVNGDRQATESRKAAVGSLARELDLPVEQVERVYAQESARIEADARIKTFVPVVVASRVRAELRRQQQNR